MKKFSYSTLYKVVHDLNNKVINNRIGNFSLINSRDFLIQFTVYRKEKLLISLNHQLPFVSFVGVDESIPTLLGQANDIIRKECRDALIKSIDIINEDRIMRITIEKSNDYFEKETKYLIFELIPHRPNFILLNADNIVLYASHYSSLDNKYMVIKGMTYEGMKKSENYINIEDSLSLEEVKEYAKQYLFEAKNHRLKEKYEYLFKYLKSRNKSLNQKITILNNEINNAEKGYKYLDIGNTLLSYINSEDELRDYIKGNNIEMKENYSVGQMANLYFKKYKKSKRTIEMDKIELDKVDKEIKLLNSVSCSINYMDEDELIETAKELILHKAIIKGNKKEQQSRPSFVKQSGFSIFFGKNSKQNELITFKLANKDSTYLHIKDYHGSHVVIMEPNPTKEILLLAAEICLIMSNKSVGDIQYTLIKNVKKGDSTGLALLNSYQLITLNSVRKETFELVRNAKK